MNAVQRVLSRVRISEVYRALTGIAPRRTGRETWRAPAPWRGGDSPDSVSGNDSRGVFHDFVDDSHGGVLDLVRRVRAGSRAEALRWTAGLAGVPIEDRHLSPEDRARWAAERCELERDLPDARYWRRAVLGLAEEALNREKSRLFDPTADGPTDVRAIADITAMISRLEAMPDVALVATYRDWRVEQPQTTALLVRIARQREQADVRTLCRYFGFPESGAATFLRGAK